MQGVSRLGGLEVSAEDHAYRAGAVQSGTAERHQGCTLTPNSCSRRQHRH